MVERIQVTDFLQVDLKWFSLECRSMCKNYCVISSTFPYSSVLHCLLDFTSF